MSYRPVRLGVNKTKSRLFSRIVTYPNTLVYNNVGTLIQSVPTPDNFEIGAGAESIKYTTSHKGLPLRYNACIHERNLSPYGGPPDANDSVSIADLRPSNPGGSVVYNGRVGHSKAAHAKAVTAANNTISFLRERAFVSASGSDWINVAAERLKPDLTELSVPNFLYEMKDLAKLFKFWQKGKSLAKNVAGAHLNFSFGWKPTIGDIKNSIQGVTNLQAKLAAWNASVGSVQQRRMTAFEDIYTADGETTYELSDKVKWRVSVTRDALALIKYKPMPIKSMGALDQYLRGQLDVLGVELNPRIIWEAIPFSFVVDWFLNIGAALESFKIDTLELPFEYVDSCVQYKEEYEVISRLRLKDAAGFSNEIQTAGWTTKQSYFERLPITPNGDVLSLVGWRLPKLHQAILLVSLTTVLSRGR